MELRCLKCASARGFEEGMQSTRSSMDLSQMGSGDLLCSSVPSPSAPVPLQFPRPFLGSSGALGDAVVLRKAGMPGRQQLVLVPRAGNPAWRLWLCQCFGGAVPAPGDCLWGLGLLHCCWKLGTVQNGSDTEPASKHGLFSLLLYIKPKAPSYCFGSCWRCSLSTEHFSCV